ncbi:MAG TPA: hypothetical protein VMV02_08070 [Acidimicrobiales bacterium]|nr:hypothetical protein [Acidimicrobiales bacterium]
MHDLSTGAGVLATVNKHHLAGIVGIVAGVVLAALGATKVIGRTVAIMVFPIVGLVIALVGVLLYARVV